MNPIKIINYDEAQQLTAKHGKLFGAIMQTICSKPEHYVGTLDGVDYIKEGWTSKQITEIRRRDYPEQQAIIDAYNIANP